MLNILTEKYELKNPDIKKLVGYDNQNYLISSGESFYILKVYTDADDIAMIVAENEVLLFLAQNDGNKFPKPVINRYGEYITLFYEKGTRKYLRLLNYVEGVVLNNTVHSEELFRSVGKFLGELDKLLADYKNQVIEKRKFKWDIQFFGMNEKYFKYIPDKNDRKIVEYFYSRYKEIVVPVLQTLPKQIIHNDANEWNILVTDNRVTGLIDFGDISYSHTVNELAIVLAYSLLGKETPLRWAVPVVKEYCKIVPLIKKEVDILYYLVAARLCISVSNSAFERVNRPENSYIQVSEKGAWNMLRKWVGIDPALAVQVFSKAAGLQ